MDQFRLLLGRLERGRPEQSLLITGLRGVGKTVLLDAFEGLAIAQKWFASFTEVTTNTRLPAVLATMSRAAVLDFSRQERVKERARRALSIVKGFTIGTPIGVDLRIDLEPIQGIADSGDLGRDIGDLLIEIGEVARDADRGIVFLLDEIQFLSRTEFEALIAGMHRASRKQLPITVVGAGLPLLPKLAGEAKSYAERLFVFPRIGSLPEEAARAALVEPALEEKVAFQEKALVRILEASGKYPYFIQQYGKHAWLEATGKRITLSAVEAAHGRVMEILDKDFFHVRIERATDAERRYLSAMAQMGDDPRKSGDVTRALGYSTTMETGTTRDNLIKKGLIYSPSYGFIDFTVPKFADYMRRNHPIDVD